MIKEISFEDFKKNQEKFVLIDVREDFELIQDGKLENSILISLGEINAEKVLLSNPNKKDIVIYCRSGKRSMAACEIISNDIKEFAIYNLKGGILATKI
jgi:rhodanese-related sulfurtransferase